MNIGKEILDAVRQPRVTNYTRSMKEVKQNKVNGERRQGAMGREKPRCDYCNG